MELTDEEKKLFKIYDEELGELPSYHIQNGLLNSYYSNNESVQITHGYIKKFLIEVAKRRGLVINSDETFDMDALLTEIINIPEELSDFSPIYFKSEEHLQYYVDNKTRNMNLKEIEGISIDFNGIGGFRECFKEYMAKYISSLLAKIDQLEFESQEEKKQEEDDWVLDNPNASGESTITYMDEGEENVWVDWEGLDDSEGKQENQYIDEQEFPQDYAKDMKVSDDELINYIKYINSFPQLHKYKTNAKRVGEKLMELAKQKKLEEFYSDKSFVKEFKKIMAHDTKKHIYHFHGTQSLKDAETIMQEGLGMMRESLDSTSYTEFTMDQVILYSRGFGGEIGRDAIVIIDEPRMEGSKSADIVKPLSSDRKIHFSPSGLQGLDGKPEYVVDPQYIVGYVNKRNKEIIYNPKYYAYDKFNEQKESDRPKGVPYSNDRIVEGILNTNAIELTETMEKDDLQK